MRSDRFSAFLSLVLMGAAASCEPSPTPASTGQAVGSGTSTTGSALGSGSSTSGASGLSATGSASASGGPASGSAGSGAVGSGLNASGAGAGYSGTPASGALSSGASTTGAGQVDGGGGATSGSSGLAPDASMPPVGGGLGAAVFATGELDPPSNGGTITFQSIGAAGSYPSRRDPASGRCDAVSIAGCCRTQYAITSNALTPWDEDLIMTLRGPLLLKQFATYEPAAAPGAWQLVSAWDNRAPASAQGIAFDKAFTGGLGSVCLVNASTSRAFPCGAGSVPYCTTPNAEHDYGWSGAKLFVLLMAMPRQSALPNAPACGPATNGWYDAPWIGLSLGELVREGAFSPCNCYSNVNPNAGDGCGQFNAFEVVNDNNAYTNLDVFSTNFFGYGGYVGEGPCGPKCSVSKLAANVDLIAKSTDTAALAGAIATQGVPPAPGTGPGAALRRPEAGYRYFVILLDVASRTVQLGIVHPQKIPASIAPLLPALPASVRQSTIDALVQLRLPM